MKRKALILTIAGTLAGLAAAYGGGAWWAGKAAERTLAKQHKWLASLPYFVVTQREYQRGWFSSTESATIKLNPQLYRFMLEREGEALPQFEVRYTQHVQHGPLPLLLSGNPTPYKAVVTTDFVFSAETRQFLEKMFGQQRPISIQNRIGFGDDGRIALGVPAFRYEETLAGVSVTWQGLKAELQYDGDFNKVKLDASAAGLAVTVRDRGRFAFDGLQLALDQARGKTGLMLGTSSAQIKGMTLELSGAQALRAELQDLAYRSELSENGDFVDGSADLKLARLLLDGQQYGPAELATEAKHLHGPTLAKLGRELTRLQQQAPDREQLAAEVLKLARDQGMPLLAHDPQLAIKSLYMRVPDGDIRFAGRVGLKGFVPADLDQPASFVSKLNADAEFTMPRQVLEAVASWQARALFGGTDSQIAQADLDFLVSQFVEGQLQRMASQNLIRIDGDTLSARASLAGGRFVLNGRAVPMPWDEPTAPGPDDDPDAVAASAPPQP
ncbi:YdgA family protein [Chitiniphilus purpureus]|uniref:YdgA family protein n=1 Tax=Chitiniphilus purpureus TaxID=2981137 RepID=A0ABY6DS66_9NEIS|nr:YdgA family protein [Chitiniphilus sp. CD1]UXY14743.1 YdgA family protein [Chitiniphilus sp. CD1]